MKIALIYAPEVFDLRGRVMGRQSAGRGWLRALAKANFDSVFCYATSHHLAEMLKRDLNSFVSRPPSVDFISLGQPERLREAGTLYCPDPEIGVHAWRRQPWGIARAYSLCGATHSLSSKGAMAAVADLPEAPLYSWDALVCTSTVARDVVRRLIEARMEHLRSRFGVTQFTLPQFPLIPLGVHCIDFAATPEDRAAARAGLGLGEDDVAVLFAGRLVFHAKAHPLPMLLGLERAAIASRVPVCLLIFGQFPNKAIEAAFREEAARFAPSVRLTVLDGAVAENGPLAWAAADIFTSLSDNIQETFGLTPVEAMAAGLPVVVSDWDGYKDTVRDGIDGFRVPVVMPPPGLGSDIADRRDFDMVDYDRYIGEVSLFTAVDVEAAVEAYRRLIVSHDLRRSMGEAGRKRAREVFDWSIIFRRYMALWEELAERRRSDPHVPGEDSRAHRPDRPDPFDLFKSLPTAALGPGTRIRLSPAATLDDAIARKQLKSVAYASPVLPSDAVISRLITALAAHPEGTTVGELQKTCSPIPIDGVIRSVAFLAKMGIVDVLPPPHWH